MNSWRVQYNTGTRAVRDPRWLWLRTKRLPVWNTIHVGVLSIDRTINGGTTVRFVAIPPDRIRVIDMLTAALDQKINEPT